MRGKWIAVIAATTMTLAACGSSKTDEAAGGATSTDAAAVATTVATTEADPATTKAPTPTEPVVTEPVATEVATDDTFPALDTIAPVDTDFTGDGSGEFCDLMREYDTLSNGDDFNATDPAALEKTWTELSSAMKNIQSKAPAEIADDIDVVAGAFSRLAKVLADNNYDQLKAGEAMQADPELATLFGGGSSEFETATARLDAYGTNVCGLSS